MTSYCHILFIFITIMIIPLAAEVKPMKFKAPSQTEEESHSSFLPNALRCDACQAIVHQTHRIFAEFNNVHKYFKHNLPESEVIELVEKACKKDQYESYGIKTVNGENRLNGPGVVVTESVAGMIAGGGRWPNRLSIICNEFVEELGDEGLYNLYKKTPRDKAVFYAGLCEGSTKMTSACKNKGNGKKDSNDGEMYEKKGKMEDKEDL